MTWSNPLGSRISKRCHVPVGTTQDPRGANNPWRALREGPEIEKMESKEIKLRRGSELTMCIYAYCLVLLDKYLMFHRWSPHLKESNESM